MNKLDRLIQELCPNGVVFEPLWKITIWDKKFNAVDRAKQPKVINYPYLLAVDLFALAQEGGDVFLLSTGEQTGWTTEEFAGDNLREGEIVTIPWGKSRPVAEVMKYYKGKFVTADNRIATSADTNILLNKYLYYWLLTQGKTIDGFYRGSGIKHPSMKDILDLCLPLPPLPVQSEIVRILDNFAELTAELTARKRQYEYYKSIIFEKTRGSTYRALIDIVDVRDGTHDTPKQSTEGVPLVTSKNIINGLVDVSSCYLIAASDYEAINLRSKVDTFDVLMSMIGTIGETAIVNDNSQYAIKNVGLIKCGGNKLLSQYIRFYLTSSDAKQYINANVKGTAPRYLSLTALRNFPIPFPPLEEQERIVEILDRFDALCNDITSGLPAETEARRKQYEYYRDKLLTFKEKTA